MTSTSSELSKEKAAEEYLFQHIPISQALGVSVEHASSHKIVLRAPLANNINHKKTAFGGSLHAVTTLTCWTLLHVNLASLFGEQVQIVITHSDTSYLAPVVSDFLAECEMPEDATWQRFLKMLQLKGKARIGLTARIYQEGTLSVDYQAVFAAIRIQPN